MKTRNLKNTSMLTLVLVLAGSNMATAGVIQDTYIGGVDHGWGDVIGSPDQFDVSSANVTRNGNVVSIDVYTNFAGRADDKLFPGLTSSGNGIGYGDMFLSDTWNPHGAAPYIDDNHITGTDWTYGLSLDDRWSATGGTLSLYALTGTNAQDSLLSQDFLHRGTFRNEQEIAVDTTSNTALALGVFGSWSVVTDGIYDGNDYIHFEIDLSNTNLLDGGELAIHWGMLCGNDVIEGITPHTPTGATSVSVPEPSTLALALLGTVGVGFRRRKFITS
jgi:PPE-repeat protein